MAYIYNRQQSDNDPYNEVNINARKAAERNAPPEAFFYNTGNPFLGFMRFLRRIPVPKKQVEPQRLMADLREIANTKKTNMFTRMFGVIIVIFAACILSAFNGGIAVLAASIAIVIIFFKTKTSKTTHGYTVNDYKAYVVEQSIAPFVDEIVYEPNFGIPYSVVKDLNVVRMGNRYSTEDLVTGKYRNVYFAQADMRIEYKSDDSTIIYFRGKWIAVKYPKGFSGTVTAVDRDYMNRIRKAKGLEYVSMENESFNSLFAVESSSQHLAYYLLTPQLMERIMYIKQYARGQVVVCFKNGYLHIGINNYQNTFEPDYNKLDLYSDIEKFRNEFNLVRGIIEILDIDKSVYNQ